MRRTRKARARRASSSAQELPVAALKIKPAAKYLGGLSAPTIYRLVKQGELVPVRKIRTLLFPISELDRFLKT